MEKEPKYPKTDASLKSKGGGAKDAGAYSAKAGSAASGARKGAPLDKAGMTSKKDESCYKDSVKDQ